MIYIKALLLIALLFLAITFGIQNSESVVLRYYFDLASVPVPLYLVIYLAIILGVLSGLAIDVYSRVNLKGKLKKLEKTNASLQEDLDKLKVEAGKEPSEESEITPAESEIRLTQPLPASSQAQPDETGSETESEPA